MTTSGPPWFLLVPFSVSSYLWHSFFLFRRCRLCLFLLYVILSMPLTSSAAASTALTCPFTPLGPPNLFRHHSYCPYTSSAATAIAAVYLIPYPSTSSTAAANATVYPIPYLSTSSTTAANATTYYLLCPCTSSAASTATYSIPCPYSSSTATIGAIVYPISYPCTSSAASASAATYLYPCLYTSSAAPASAAT